jgi:putative FmdB family regulatory protein
MPTYVYECTACSTRFERWQSFHDDPITVCPECEGTTRRVYFPAGIIFKGSGWYITDSRKNGASNGASASTSDGKTDGSSDTKSTEKASDKSETKVGV